MSKLKFDSSRLRSDFDIKKNFLSIFIKNEETDASLDGWRVVAITWLLTIHCIMYSRLINTEALVQSLLNNPAFRFILHGHFSADIFFVLSGYLIGKVLIKEKSESGSVNLIRFYLRRALRILPTYFAVLLVVYVLIQFGVLPDRYFKGTIFPNIFLYNNFLPRREMFHTNAWSLAVEEQFYLIFPVLMIGLFGKFKKDFPILIFLVLSIIFGHALFVKLNAIQVSWSYPTIDVAEFDLYFNNIYVRPYFRFSSLLIGVMGSYISGTQAVDWIFSKKLRAVLFVLAILFGFSMLYDRMEYGSVQANFSIFFEAIYREIFSILFMGLIFIGQNVRSLQNILSSRYFYPVFKLSYSIYLVHMPIICIVMQTSLKGVFFPESEISLKNIFAFVICIFSISSVVASLFYVFIERPFTQIRNRFIFNPGRQRDGK